mgnify:FL=1
MIEFLLQNRKLGVFIFLIATQLAGGLFYFSSLISTIETATDTIAELEAQVKVLEGATTTLKFDAERNYSLNKFLSLNLEDEIADLEDDLQILESIFMQRR